MILRMTRFRLWKSYQVKRNLLTLDDSLPSVARVTQPFFNSFDFKMLKYQQLVLTLTFLSFDLIIIEAEKAKFNLKGHQAPEYASGPNGTMTNDRSLKQQVLNETMTFEDYAAFFHSICANTSNVGGVNWPRYNICMTPFGYLTMTPDDSQPKVAKMEPIFKNPLPFNQPLILLGSITAIVIVSASIGLVACHKKRKQNGSFKRLNEDPEGNETNANPANAVIWSLSNDQLIMIRK